MDNESISTFYITVTLHYIDKNWDQKALILAARPKLKEFLDKTAVNIKSIVANTSQDFGTLRTGNVLVTDNDSSEETALP